MVSDNVTSEDIHNTVQRMKKQIAYLEQAIATVCTPKYYVQRKLCEKPLRVAEVKIAEACSFVDGITDAIKREEL